MAKIPFDIKYRPQIESGEYKVVYVENLSTEQYPVEILKWDSNSDAGCIIGCIRLNGKDRVYTFGENGEHKVSGGDNRLFIIIPEEELTEFEKVVKDRLWRTFEYSDTFRKDEKKWVQELAAEFLALAKQQLLQSGELLTQEHHKELMETQYNETLEGVKKNWRDYFIPQAVTDIYNAGRNDVLKDLPRWEKQMYAPQEVNIYLPTNELVYHGMAISINELTKLPGFKEDESHE